MKTVTCVAIAVAVLAATALAQTPTAVRPAKHSETIGEPTYGGRIEGDTIEECWTIPSLPFFDTGNTCGFTFDYDEMCPYGSSSPDVVYCYSPPHDMCVSINLCDSYYDTKVYIYEDVAGNVPWPDGCNDDNFSCVDPPVTYTSWIESVEIFAGHTYYIVVDGYGGQCGDYVLAVDEIDCPDPCDVICVGVPEGEPTCYDGYDDTYNGGCLSVPPSFSHVTPSTETTTICGTSGNYDDNTYRDTDWYLFTLSGMYESAAVTACVDAEFPVFLGFIDLRLGCPVSNYYSFSSAGECETVCLTETLPSGDWVVFVSTDGWLAIPCGADYILTLDFQPVTGVEDRGLPVSWSAIKALYR